jgi:hypothetical protein
MGLGGRRSKKSGLNQRCGDSRKEVELPYRTFNDSAGAEWQVWDIVPRNHERRDAEKLDRRVDVIPIAFADRRRPESRRMGSSAARRAYLRGPYAHGWLCFESRQEKRRLSPIPLDWTVCSEEDLEAYSRAGERVPGPSRSFNFADETPLDKTG